jgi:hypothetical protein
MPPVGFRFRTKRDPREIRVIATKSMDSAALSGGQCCARFHNQVRPYWQYAAELLLIASANEGAMELARARLSRALMIEGLL